MTRLIFAILVLAALATYVFAGDPKRAAVHNKQGKAYFDAKQYDEAIVEFKKSHDLDPKPITLFKIASAYYAKGDYKGAIEYYQSYLTADPDGPFAAQAIEFSTIANKAIADEAAQQRALAEAAQIEVQRKAAEAERKAAEAETERKRLAATARIKQAQAYAQANAWASAGQEYTAAAEVSGDPAHLLDAAEAFRKAPDDVKARGAYLVYLDKVPLDPRSDEIRGKVAELTRTIEKAETAERDRQRTLRESIRVVERPSIEDPRPAFELAVSIAPGVKMYNDNPLALALRVELALRLGRRINLGVFGEYAQLDASGACGTGLPGPMPATPFDIGPRNQFTKCRYLMAGSQLYVHIRPKRRIDPYIGFSQGVRVGFVDYTTYFGGMKQSHSELLPAFVVGVRAGVTYRPTLAVRSWTLGGFVESSIQIIGRPEDGSEGVVSYVSWFVGARSTVTF